MDLGVLLTSKLNLNRHVDFITAKAASLLGLLKRFARAFQDLSVLKTLYCSLVRSRLEYAAVVWSPYHTTYSDRLESVQKQYLKFALPHHRQPGTFRLPPYPQRLQEHGLEPLWSRRLTSRSCLVYDLLLGGIKCSSLREQLTLNDRRRTRISDYLAVPFHRTDYGKYEAMNSCRLNFNAVSHIFLEGPSRAVFRQRCADHFISVR